MAIAVASTSNTPAYGTRANTTITAPAGISDDDLLVAILDVGDGTALPALSVTPPAGWTEVTNSPVAADEIDPYTISIRIFYKVASGESGDYTFTHTTADTQGFMYRLTGCDTTTPIDTNPAGNSGDGSTTTLLSVTTTRDDCFIIAADCSWDAAGAGDYDGTTPTLTARRTGFISKIFDGTQTTAGATGSRTRTNGNAGGVVPWISIVVPIRPAPPPVITFGSVSSTTYASRTNTTVTAPTGITNGDLLIAQLFLGTGTPPTPTAPSGWTQIGTTQTGGEGGFNVNVRLYGKIASGESGNYTWTHTSCSSQGAIARYSQVSPTSSINTHSSLVENNPATTTRTATSITTTVDGCMLCYIGWDWADNADGETPPTGMTERLDNTLFYWADEIQASEGSTGARTNTCNSVATTPRGAWLVALTPDAGGSPQNITGAIYSDADTIFGSTVSATRAITGALYTDTDLIYEADIVIGETITCVLFAEGETYHSATVLNASAIDGSLYNDPDTFYGSIIQSSNQFVSGNLYTDPDTFYSSLTGSGYGFTASLYTDPDVFNQSLVSTGVVGATFSDADTFYDAIVSHSNGVVGDLYSDADTFYGSSLSLTIRGDIYLDADTFYGSSFSQSQTIDGNIFIDSDTFSTALLEREEATTVEVTGLQLTIALGNGQAQFWKPVPTEVGNVWIRT